MTAPNRNALWASIFVEELARGGLKAVSTSPGSRSTPLILAFSRHPEIEVYTHGDERSAAFFALGMAQASGRAVAVLCTSGTAAANFHPAVVEAFYAHVPLLILTADRPHEQRDSGANQTIDQVKLYGHHVLWAAEVPPPEKDPPDRVLRALRTLAGRALFTANGLRKGPVHLNVPFRKPLEPTPGAADTHPNDMPGLKGRKGAPFTQLSHGVLRPTHEQVERLKALVEGAPRGVIVCGPRCPGGGFAAAVVKLAEALGYPILADGLSGVRFGPHVEAKGPVLGAHETLFSAHVLPDPEVVVRFGAMPLSAQLGQALEAWAAVPQLAVNGHGLWTDAAHSLGQFLWVDPEHTCRALAGALEGGAPKDTAWLAHWQALERTCWRVLGKLRRFCEQNVVRDVVFHLPQGACLFVSNSLPVRHLDQFVPPSPKSLEVFANRGASGIDGIISSASGVAAARRAPTVLLLGDLAFCHDLNGLLALQRYDLKLVIVLLNNDGGAIFQRLPVSRFEPPFRELFVTPHGLNFAHAAHLFGLDYAQTTSREAFVRAYRGALASERSTLLEVPFEGEKTHQQGQQMVEKVITSLRKSFPYGKRKG